MLTFGDPTHTMIYYLPASELIGVCELHPTEVSPTRTFYTVAEFMAAISPEPDQLELALVDAAA